MLVYFGPQTPDIARLMFTHPKGQFLDLNWPVKLVLTDRFA